MTIKKWWYSILILSLLPLSSMGDNYSSWWRQVTEAGKKDLPQTQLAVLQKIVSKAEKKKDYGQLLSAELMTVSLKSTVSPDSLSVGVSRLEAKERQAAVSDPVLASVYASALGRFYAENPSLGEDHEARSQRFYDLSLQHTDLLARQKSSVYTPLFTDGVDSRIFGNDLLHVIGFQAGAYRLLHDYYERTGNREAACICACRWMEKNQKVDVYDLQRSTYLQTLDSLLKVYGDLPSAGELALIRYRYLASVSSVTAGDRIRYIDEALDRWGGWTGMEYLRNERKTLTNPTFSIALERRCLVPGRSFRIQVNEIRNLPVLSAVITRLSADAGQVEALLGARDYTSLSDVEVQQLEKWLTKDRITENRHYTGLEPWQMSKDSFNLKGLSPGVYLLEVSTPGTNIAVKRALFFVSDVVLLQEEQPGKAIRYAVVHASTGQPWSNADIRLSFGNRPSAVDTVNLHCNEQGEVVYHYDSRQPSGARPTTADDSYSPSVTWAWNNYTYYENRQKREYLQLYTDRKVYRPGQTVQVAGIAYTVANGVESRVEGGKNVELTLRDANGKSVGTQQLTTDALGMVATSFVLPSTGLTGQFAIRDAAYKGAVFFSVEEYRRPTFHVEFPNLTRAYQVGDTLSVKGLATTYSGVPVQNAQVKYKVVRRPSLWWRWNGDFSEKTICTDTAVTNEKGEFFVTVPLIPDPHRDNVVQFFTYQVQADVTDVGGETQGGSLALPLGTRSTAFSCDLPDQAERDSLKTLRFSYRNAAGNDLSAAVKFRLDGGPEQWTRANETTILHIPSDLPNGRHTLSAICGTDTLKQDFILFSVTDKVPVVDTQDWFYQSSDYFRRDGQPVYVQVGSSEPDQHILYSVFSGNKVLESGTIDQNRSFCTRAYTYREEYGDGLRLTWAWVKDGVFYQHSTTLAKPLPDKRLNLAWASFRDRLIPGQKEEWTLRITRPDGSPARAQLLSVLYNKSLDQIRGHQWNFSPYLSRNLPYTMWTGPRDRIMSLFLSGQTVSKVISVGVLHFTAFNPLYFRTGSEDVQHLFPGVRALSKPMRLKAMNATTMEATALGPMTSSDEVQKETTSGLSEEEDGISNSGLRENLGETAFFYPDLLTDQQGKVTLKFTLPESVTTWRFMAFAHDADLNYGMMSDEAVARKTVMIQPNIPRFLRFGDQSRIIARIMNTSEQAIRGKARMELLDPETEEVLYIEEHPYSLQTGGTQAIGFQVDLSDSSLLVRRLTAKGGLLVCRMRVFGDGFSDGEQHYLPVLPNREQVTNTYAFTWAGPVQKVISLGKLFPEGSEANKLTVEYTTHPAWLVIQSLPYLVTFEGDNAVNLATALYADGIGRYLLSQNPVVRRVIDLWNGEKTSGNSLMSNLEKDQELKSLVLSEIPWVMEADREGDQKRRLVQFFDENSMKARRESFLAKLYRLQQADGSWSWWPGMPGNLYMTEAVSEVLVRLNAMIGLQPETQNLLDRSLQWMAKCVHEEVSELKRQKNRKALLPSESALHFLYITALDGRPLSVQGEADKKYLVDLLLHQSMAFSIYGKSRAAVILALNGYQKQAREYLQSVREYSVSTAEAGRYFDTGKAMYSWADYRIPTEVAAIEAFKILEPGAAEIGEMQRWLLHEKRTTSWDTPLNAVDAVYAFGTDRLKVGVSTSLPVVQVDGKRLELPQATAGLGYVKTSMTIGNEKILTVEKQDSGISWGAVYAQFMQRNQDISDTQSGMKVVKEVRTASGPLQEGALLQVGDRVKVRLTITCDRDYDFVQIVDKRAACMEPVKSLSGYQNGYYYSPLDQSTNYFFNQLAKGSHVVETEYYIDRSGRYQSGTCTVQCAYSPEFGTRTAPVWYEIQ